MATKSCSLDTNCLVALVVPGRDRQRKAIERVLHNYSVIRVDDQVYIELEYVLTGPASLPRAKAADAIESLLNLAEITCSRSLMRDVLRMYVDHPSLSFTDIYLAKKAASDDADPLLTFDKKLASQMSEAKLAQ